MMPDLIQQCKGICGRLLFFETAFQMSKTKVEQVRRDFAGNLQWIH